MRSITQGAKQPENAEQERHRGGDAKKYGRNPQRRERSLIEVRFERPHEDRARAVSWYLLNPATQIGQQRAVYLPDVDNHVHGCKNVLRHRQIQRGLHTPLESSKRPGMHYPDDVCAAALLIDNRSSNRVSAEVEVSGLLIDDANPASRGFGTAAKSLAGDKLAFHGIEIAWRHDIGFEIGAG